MTQPLGFTEFDRIGECPSATVRIQQLRRQYVAAAADLLSISFYPQSGWLSWLTPVMRLGIYQDLLGRLQTQRPHSVCWVALVDETSPVNAAAVVGVVEVAVRSLSAWAMPMETVPYISNLAVDPAYRRQRIAMQLLMSCEQSVKDWGFSELYLHAMADNIAARRLYARMGYQVQPQSVPWFLSLSHPQQVLWRKHL